MIIFGWRVVFFTLSRGVFHCPECGGDREYRRRYGRNFFSLFFIPVIPLNKSGGEFVQCDTCKGRWNTAVLEIPTTAELAQMPAMLLRMAVSQVLRSGDPAHQGARRRAVTVVRQAGDAGYDEAALDGDMGRSFDQVRAEMARASSALAPEARESILRAAAEIALADGTLSVSEEETLAAVGTDLELTRVQVTGVVSLARQSSGH
ncbi:zinc-ribbon domain-containing protein [Actinomadura xylanilytica]|uniref:zinc-ribbon domain-containing protein n=1 Tax=Actinomadura xylanilytica TaxID=887459 RepID=UPI00255AA7C4|nr:TerB family tellurite resistance protein [Actinomadura xylanilytica]MDL4775169.1 TerB family tellurite resistance protein [Actinomadura xylanilytica]